MERISRRTFLKKIVRWGIVAAGIEASVYVGNSILPPLVAEPPDGGDLDTIQTLSKEIAPHIRDEGFLYPFKFDGQLVQVSPNRQVISQTLLQLAYLDGGAHLGRGMEMEKVNGVAKFIRDTNLVIRPFDNKLGWLGANGRMAPWGKTVVVEISTDVLHQYYREQPSPSNEDILWHELQHVIQLVRHPELFYSIGLVEQSALIGFGVILGPLLAKWRYTKELQALARKWDLTREEWGEFISTYDRIEALMKSPSLAFIFGPLAYFTLGRQQVAALIDPFEHEAYLRTVFLGRHFASDEIRGRQFIFERLNG